MLEFKNVTFKYKNDNIHTTKNLNFSINKGDFVSIIGKSGSGKSTLLRLINKLEKPEYGEILINNQNINQLNNYCSFMPQKDLLFPWRTIKKNLLLPIEIKNKMNKNENEQKVIELLEQIGLIDYINKYPNELSGGMKQRISFARTLISGNDILLLDEPFSALDYFTKIDMQKWLIKQWKYFKKTIIFITHDVEEAIYLSNYIYIIKNRPFSNMKKIEIKLKYPRNRDTKEIIEIKKNILEILEKKENF